MIILEIISLILWIIIGILNISEGIIKKDYKVDLINYIIIWGMLIVFSVARIVK